MGILKIIEVIREKQPQTQVIVMVRNRSSFVLSSFYVPLNKLLRNSLMNTIVNFRHPVTPLVSIRILY